jgi:hypothetical protein
MVHVKYKGNLGNKMFQYALGRYLAEEMGYQLLAEPLPFTRTNERVSGRSNQSPIELLECQMCDIQAIVTNRDNRAIILDGWFQQSAYYVPIMERIRNWFTIHDEFPRELAEVNDCDLLLSVRLGDYFSIHKLTLTHQFYETVIDMVNPRKIYIATDEPNHPFLDRFKKYNPWVLRWSFREKIILDLLSARKFNKIAISCSTFSWWSALLSDASEIYFPIDDDGIWSMCHRDPPSIRNNLITSIDLRIDDPRFTYFYNCPTIKSNRLSTEYVTLASERPDLAPFHKNSTAFWCK